MESIDCLTPNLFHTIGNPSFSHKMENIIWISYKSKIWAAFREYIKNNVD